MKHLLIALVFIVACKKKGFDDVPTPIMDGRCYPMQYAGDRISDQWCQWKAYWWHCSDHGDVSGRVCTRDKLVAAEEFNSKPGALNVP